MTADIEPVSVALTGNALRDVRGDGQLHRMRCPIGPISLDARQSVDDGQVDGRIRLDFAADQLPEFADVSGVLRAEYSELNADAVAALLDRVARA